MEKYINSTIERAMALRKNATFALNNALSFAITSMDVPPAKSLLFSVKFNDDDSTNEVYFNGKTLGVDIVGLLAMGKEKIQTMIGNDEVSKTDGDLLLPNVDFIK